MRIETQKVLMSETVPEEDNNGISQSFFCLCLLYHPPSYPQFKENKLIPSTNVYKSWMPTVTFCVLLRSRISHLFPNCQFGSVASQYNFLARDFRLFLAVQLERWDIWCDSKNKHCFCVYSELHSFCQDVTRDGNFNLLGQLKSDFVIDPSRRYAGLVGR